MYIKDKLIKFLGGYTKKEYTRIERKYQGLLDSKTDNTIPKIVNEYIERTLKDLYLYTKSLYQDSFWASKMYHVIFNNMIRINVRYSNSSVIYRIDTTLDSPNQFANILRKDGRDDIDTIIENILETD